MALHDQPEQTRDDIAPGRTPAARNGSALRLAPAEQPNDDERQDDTLVPLGTRDPKGVLFVSPKRTLPTAEALVREHYQRDEHRTLQTFGGTLWRWEGNRYVETPDAALAAELLPYLHDAKTYTLNRRGAVVESDFPANHTTVHGAIEAVKALTFLPADRSPTFWIDGRKYPDPSTFICCKTYNYLWGPGEILGATPELFNVNAVDFDPTPDAPAPALWLKFLNELWPDDPQQVEALQEWFGYLLTAETNMQKILLMVGPRRSGKGTIFRLLRRLVGEHNYLGLMAASLAGPFGLQPLIGKTVAAIPDARFHGENIVTVVERLLAISGEDAVTVERKHRESVTHRLPVRFVILSNEVPKLSDASNALTGRFIVLKTSRSWYGKEDPHLETRLAEELPGVFLWAVEGLKRLHARGRFVQPDAGRELLTDMEDLSQPLGQFVRERCVIGPECRVDCRELYQLYRGWADDQGHQKLPTAAVFGQRLKAAVTSIQTKQGTRGRFFLGIGIGAAIGANHPSAHDEPVGAEVSRSHLYE